MTSRWLRDYIAWQTKAVPGTPETLLLKTREEVDEFFADPNVGEAIDVIACLVAWANSVGIDPEWLQGNMEQKLDQWRQRTYELQPDGTWHH